MRFTAAQLAVIGPLVTAFVLGVAIEVVGVGFAYRRSRWGRRLLGLAFFVFWIVVAISFLAEFAFGLADVPVGIGGVVALGVGALVAARLPAVWRLPPPE